MYFLLCNKILGIICILLGKDNITKIDKIVLLNSVLPCFFSNCNKNNIDQKLKLFVVFCEIDIFLNSFIK